MRHFCTYFDHRYLSAGLALYESLQRHMPDSTLWVLCLSKECEVALTTADLPRLRLLALDTLEHNDPELAATRFSRSLVEYYFTCSPCLPRFLLQAHPEIDAITYLDADLYFFSSPCPIFSELENADIGITPHRFPARRESKLSIYGLYNVGWLTFRRSEAGLACLDWWRARCLEWCFDRVEAGRFADQKYLDHFGKLFARVHAIAHPGANLAPWNVAEAHLAEHEGKVTVDDAPLVFYHFQGLKEVRVGVYDTNLDDYSARLTPELKRLVYLPYLEALRKMHERQHAFGVTLDRSSNLRGARAGLRRPAVMLDQMATSLRALLTGSIIRI